MTNCLSPVLGIAHCLHEGLGGQTQALHDNQSFLMLKNIFFISPAKHIFLADTSVISIN